MHAEIGQPRNKCRQHEHQTGISLWWITDTNSDMDVGHEHQLGQWYRCGSQTPTRTVI